MLSISLDPALQRVAPRLTVGVLTAGVRVTPHDADLWREIDAQIAYVAGMHLTMDQARQMPALAALRSAYRALGVDPTRYRGSNEALVRRIVQGKGLYQVNTVVDINNLLSLETLCSCGTMNLQRIVPPVVFRPGRAGETYAGIGRGPINLAGLPLFADSLGPFGSTTSDSERTQVGLDAEDILFLVISFGGPEAVPEALARATGLLVRFAAAQRIETAIVSACSRSPSAD